MKYWVIRGRPDVNGDFSILKRRTTTYWRTKSPPSTWEIGDRMFFWASVPRLELLGIGEFRGETDEFTANGELIYAVRCLSSVVSRPIHQSELKQDRIVQAAVFLKKGPAQSVVRLTSHEGDHLYRLLLSRNPELSGIWPDLEAVTAEVPDIDVSAIEGERRLVQHMKIERNPKLAEAKKRQVLNATGRLECEACGFDFSEVYGELGENFCEVHHRRPLSSLNGRTKTRLSDLAIVCSNCHRMLHRNNCEISVAQLKQRISTIGNDART